MKRAYDDPYVLLAYKIVAYNIVPEICRILTDDEYVKKLILKETRSQDFAGSFLDVIVQGILDDKRRMEFMHRLDKLGEYFWVNFDIDRLRREILMCCDSCGIRPEVDFFLESNKAIIIKI